MVNERRQRGISNWQRQAWLMEYQACQHDNSSSGTSYWTVAGTFIGVSSVLLGALVYGVFANIHFLTVSEGSAPNQVLALRVLISVVCIAIILILSFLRLWLKRVSFLQQINFERMRNIESQLGMWKSWRVHGVDHWRGDNFDDSISDEDKTRLQDYKPQDWWRGWKTRARFERPSGWHYDWIFGAFIFLWLFLIFSVWILLLSVYIALTYSVVIALVFAIGIAWLIVYSTRAG